MTSSTAFEQAWELGDRVPGWLTVDQAAMLWRAASRLGPGARIVEIGSHQGRSTTVLGLAARSVGATVVAVDPFVEGKLFGGTSTRARLERNVSRAGLADVVRLEAEYSTRLRKRWNERIDLLYIDGKHDYWTLSDDLKWARHLEDGAPVLIHDCYSSIGVTLGVLAKVLPSRTLRYERRAGSLALFRVGTPSVADRVRILREVPWWLRNVVVKVLLRLRLRAVAARAFGHDSPYDPF